MFDTSPLSIRARIFSHALQRKILKRDFVALPRPETLHSAETITCRPALFDTDQLSRVRACGFVSTLEKEVAKLTATQFTETPLQRYHLGPAVIAGGTLLSGTGSHFFATRSAIQALRGKMQRFDTMHLASTEQGLKYFGHWLRDDCTLYEWLRENGHAPIAMTRPHWPDTALYERVFEQRWEDVDFAYAADLTVYRELGFNRDKARRIHLLRDRLRAKAPARTGGQIVYISRGVLGSPRNMSNGDAFESAMEAAGIQVVHPGTDPEQLSAAILDARIIITIEGSQAAHGVYHLGDGGAMLILQSPDRFYNPHHEWARLIGMGYGTVIGTPDDVSYTIDPDDVLRMVERLDSETCQASA